MEPKQSNKAAVSYSSNSQVPTPEILEPKQSNEAGVSSSKNPQVPTSGISKTRSRDFLLHLEDYLSERDGVDKVLETSVYAIRIILASSVFPENHHLRKSLESLDSTICASREAFALGKFIQGVNALRRSSFTPRQDWIFQVLAIGGSSLYDFVEQFVLLGKVGFFDKKYLTTLQKISSCGVFLGHIRNTCLDVKDLRGLEEDEAILLGKIEASKSRGTGCLEEKEKLRNLREQKLMKKIYAVHGSVCALMDLADICDGKGRLWRTLWAPSVGFLLGLISNHRHWISC